MDGAVYSVKLAVKVLGRYGGIGNALTQIETSKNEATTTQRIIGDL